MKKPALPFCLAASLGVGCLSLVSVLVILAILVLLIVVLVVLLVAVVVLVVVLVLIILLVAVIVLVFHIGFLSSPFRQMQFPPKADFLCAAYLFLERFSITLDFCGR